MGQQAGQMPSRRPVSPKISGHRRERQRVPHTNVCGASGLAGHLIKTGRRGFAVERAGMPRMMLRKLPKLRPKSDDRHQRALCPRSNLTDWTSVERCRQDRRLPPFNVKARIGKRIISMTNMARFFRCAAAVAALASTTALAQQVEPPAITRATQEAYAAILQSGVA